MKTQLPGMELEFCKGIGQGCKNALLTMPELINAMEKLYKSSYWTKKFPSNSAKQKVHELLKIGISACPNACAKSQIKDIGIIVRAEIRFDPTLCDGCFICIDTCADGALTFTPPSYDLIYDNKNCVGCGKCTQTCPSHALSMPSIYFDLMLGGRLGRHPRFAESILKLKPNEFLDFFSFFLSLFEKYSNLKQTKELFNKLSPRDIKDAYLKR